MRMKAKLVSGLLCGLLLLTGCGLAAEPELDLVDPQSADFVRRQDEVVQVSVQIEALIAAAAKSAIEPGGYQEVGCRVGRHTKGQNDDFDSRCGIHRQTRLKTADPVKALLSVEAALRKAGYPGGLYGGPDGRVELDAKAVRRGTVPAAEVTSGTFSSGYRVIQVQVGRKGQPDDLLQVLTLAGGYYHQSAGDGWKPGMSHDLLPASVLVVTFQQDPFIETPRTDWG
jgi:hypothetical protein